jgi:hypothetical protein
MATHLKPPSPLPQAGAAPIIFLAGSIDMGKAEDWQADVARRLQDAPVVLLNPRRDDWDPTWKQDIANPPFREQVEWELDGLDRADAILMYLAPGSQAPISLLELGLYAGKGTLIVCCAKTFWRRGNVAVVCQRYGIPLLDHLDDAVTLLRQRLGLAQAD